VNKIFDVVYFSLPKKNAAASDFATNDGMTALNRAMRYDSSDARKKINCAEQ
jgi:hypothetical protein